MRLSWKQQIFAFKVSMLIQWAFKHGYNVTLGEAYRTERQQEYYVTMGRSKTMKSKHLQRLAIDLNLFIDSKYVTDSEQYRPIGEYWESIGGTWGGNFKNFKDGNHFEY